MRIGVLIIALAITGCEGPSGAGACMVTDDGRGSRIITCSEDGSLDATAAVSGTVLNSVTGAPIAGATIALEPAVTDVHPVTTGDGQYAVTIPSGAYDVTFAATHFQQITEGLMASGPVTLDVALMPTREVIVTAAAERLGSLTTLHATIENLGTASGAAFSWKQTSGPMATIASPCSATTTVVMGEQQATFQITVTMDDGSVSTDDIAVP